MAIVFWDTDGVIHMDFLEHGTTINSQPLQWNTQNFETTNYKVYAYVIRHNYVLGGTLFTTCEAQLHVSAINVGHHLQPEDGQHLWPKHVVVLYI
jgi:hypothetical protein